MQPCGPLWRWLHRHGPPWQQGQPWTAPISALVAGAENPATRKRSESRAARAGLWRMVLIATTLMPLKEKAMALVKKAGDRSGVYHGRGVEWEKYVERVRFL